jgi:hypothetical protein
MAKTGLIGIFDRLLLAEDGLMTEAARTPPAELLRETRKELLGHVKAVGKSGDLDAILTVERSFLQNDLDRHSNSPAMTNSLRKALEELTLAEQVIPLTNDPAIYRAVDTSHGHPKSRVGGLPKDAARQFFSSHAARLLNQDKSRLEPEEKSLVDARKANMRAGKRLYAALQREALGLEPTQSAALAHDNTPAM